MCLAVSGKIKKKKGEEAWVDFNGVLKRVKITLTPKVKKGDWVMVHAGFTIQTLTQKDAQDLSELLEKD